MQSWKHAKLTSDVKIKVVFEYAIKLSILTQLVHYRTLFAFFLIFISDEQLLRKADRDSRVYIHFCHTKFCGMVYEFAI